MDRLLPPTPTPARHLSALRLLAGALVTAAIPAIGGDLLDLPFEDLLQIEIRSASKRDEQIRDIPASVTILTRDDIQRYGWVTFEQVLENVPGFFVLSTIDERLIGSRGTVGGGVQLLVNGVPQHQTRQKALTISEIAQVNIPVESIDRIEVIRGPMSVIYGNNAFLGVINVVTNDIEHNGPRASVSGGSRGSGRVFARAGAHAEDGFVVMNVGGYRTDGLDGAYADMMGPSQLADLTPGIHSSLDGDVHQRDLSLDLSAGWGEWSADLRYTQTKYGVYLFTPSFDDGNQARISTWHAALGWEHAITERLGLRATAVASEERLDTDELDFLSPALTGDQEEWYRRLDLELNLLWEPRANLNLLFGYRFRRNDDIENTAVILPLVDTTNRVAGYATNDLFAELSWSPLERLRLVSGLRLSRLPSAYRYRSEDRLSNSWIDEQVPVEDRNLVTGRIAALWSLDASQVLKLIWGTAAQDNDQIQFPEPERIATTELVYVRTRPRWTLSASLFHNQTSKIVRTIQTVDPSTGEYQAVDDNSGEWTTNGTELVAELHPWPELGLSLSSTWQQTQDRGTGIDPGYSPALLLKLKADYRHGPLTYAAYARYVGAMDADWSFVDGSLAGLVERISERVDAYWDLGANVRYQPKRRGPYASLHASNLLDTEIRYPAKELSDFERGLIAAGRIITVTVGWEF